MESSARPPSDILEKSFKNKAKAIPPHTLRNFIESTMKDVMAKPPMMVAKSIAKPPTELVKAEAKARPPQTLGATAKAPVEKLKTTMKAALGAVKFRSAARPPIELERAISKPPIEVSISSCIAKPPIEEEAVSRPPIELCKAAARPPMEICRAEARPPMELTGENHETDELFKSMKYYVIWFDQAYPYGEYSGYQEYLSEKLPGVPIKIENNYQNAIHQLNKSSANTKYILIATGVKKKKLAKEIHGNGNVDKIFVIKPFIEKIQRWSNELTKVTPLRDFKELVNELTKITSIYQSSGYKYYFKEKLISYTVEPNPMTMSEQSVRALLDELSQEDDQKRFRHQYGIALRIIKKYYEDRYQKYNETKDEQYIKTPLHGITSGEESYHLWMNLLEIALYYSECPYIFSPADYEFIDKMLEDKDSIKEEGFITSLNIIGNAIRAEKNIDENKHFETLRKLHAAFVLMLYDKQNISYSSSEKPLFIIRMLLQDFDLCVKSVIHMILNDEESELDFEYHHAAIVSDTRVSVLYEIWEAWKNKGYSVLSETETNNANREISIKNVVILSTSGLTTNLARDIKPPYRVYQYSLVRDFIVDWEHHPELKFSFCYFIIEPSVTVSQYNIILDTCIKNAITPLFILYVPHGKYSRISKDMYKSRWIVSFVYCYSYNDIKDYLSEVENNLNRDLLQYRKYYDNFRETLANKGSFSNKEKLSNQESESKEADAGWEVLANIDKNIFNQLVEEMSLGTKLVGSLHYYLLKELTAQSKENVYWKNYANLFGVTEKYTSILDVNCSKCLLRAYTLQTNPAFYKMLNDAFRTGSEENVAKYRSFFSMLHDTVKKGILKKYIGFVYRGTYFNPEIISKLEIGQKLFSSCFTSTSKSVSVARSFARKAKRNVLLEIELDPHANSNVDIHSEQCSKYPEEQEVLLLPFSSFEIKSIFKEDSLTVISLKEIAPEYEMINLKGIEYYN